MSIVKLRERGQLTIPSKYRKDLNLEENDALNVIKVGDVLILTSKRMAGDKLTKEFEKTMKKKGISLDDLLDDLKEQRKKYNKETYGTKIKT
jgi:AbrB family looped-hinge helix DNA binding protein